MNRFTKLALYAIICLTFVGCQDPTRLRNYHPGIIPLDSMAWLLAEVHLIESYRNRTYQTLAEDTLPPAQLKAMYEAVLAPHGIQPDRLIESLRYYQQQHPLLLDSLYEGVNRYLNEMLTKSYQ
jgi:hypothetical protein